MLQINWENEFRGCNCTEATDMFTKKFLSLRSSHIPNFEILCNPKDPPWITDVVKKAIRRKHRVHRKFLKNGRNTSDRDRAKAVRNETTRTIEQAKDRYFCDLGQKLCDPSRGVKAYWETIHKILNRKKVMSIPPIIEDNIFVTNFEEKVVIFNDLFVKQCSLMVNKSQIPESLPRKTQANLTRIDVPMDKIVTLINQLNCSKANGCDDISIRMLKLFARECSIPLKLIYDLCLETGHYPALWKMANVVPVHKKGDRQVKTNYRPISLLPICGKIFEKIIFDEVYKHLSENNLISTHQSGFRPGDSTINQLLSITHETYQAFENHQETRAVFLDISKAFDKVWHEGLLLKLKSNGIDGQLYLLIENFLSERYQRVVLNGKASSWKRVSAGVPQGSVLGPLFFLIYINDLAEGVTCKVNFFADDTSMFQAVSDVNMTADTLNQDLAIIQNWAFQWKMSFNPDPTKQAKEVTFSTKLSKEQHPPLSFNDHHIIASSSHKHFGLILDEKLSFAEHVKEAIIKAKRGIGIIRFLSKYVSRNVLDQMYKLYVRPHIDYGDVIYHDQSMPLSRKLESTQYKAALAVSSAWKGTNKDRLLEELGWETLSNRRWYRRPCLSHKIVNNQAPHYLRDYIPEENNIQFNLRHPTLLRENISHTLRFSKTFFPFCINAWNNLTPIIRSAPTISSCKKSLISIIRPIKKSLHGLTNSYESALLTRLRVHFSDLNEHRFDHNFACESPNCKCNVGVESTIHYFLHCHLYRAHRKILLDEVSDIVGNDISQLPDDHLCDLLLFGSKAYNEKANEMILKCTAKFAKRTKRFR